MDEERFDVDVEIRKLKEKLKEFSPESKEYANICSAIEKLTSAQYKELTYEQDRIQANLDRDVRVEEIKSRALMEKFKMWGSIAVACIAGLLGVATAGVNWAARKDCINELRDVKDDNGGWVDKDLSSMAR